MAKTTKHPLLVWPLLVTLLVVVLDRVSKYFVVRFLGPAAPVHSVPVLGSWVHLTYLENTGISFGQLQQFSFFITIFNFIAVPALLLAYRYLLTSSRWANLAVGLVLGGALGNAIDRATTALRLGIAHAYVVDFVDVRYYAVFNVADSAITVGGIIYALYLLFYHGKGVQVQELKPQEEGAWKAEDHPHGS